MLNASIATELAIRPDWERVQTVLLDMDGTLLDLRFDNYFWLELLPRRFGELHGLDFAQASAELKPRFAAKQGSLEWYCTDYWSRELGLDVVALKHEAREHIRFLPGAEAFLSGVRALGQRLVLVTNAHFDALRIKAEHTGLERYLDQVISSHAFDMPKEVPAFWPALERHIGFVADTSLFVDDNLPVLRAAKAHGIAQIFAVTRPDTTLPARRIEEFPSVTAVVDLLP